MPPYRLQQPVAVLSEGRGVPHWVLDPEPDKPAKQQVVINPLDQLPFRADRVERLQQQRAHQPLRRDRLPAERRIELGELAGQRFERGIGNLANHPQRVIRALYHALGARRQRRARRPDGTCSERHSSRVSWMRCALRPMVGGRSATQASSATSPKRSAGASRLCQEVDRVGSVPPNSSSLIYSDRSLLTPLFLAQRREPHHWYQVGVALPETVVVTALRRPRPS